MPTAQMIKIADATAAQLKTFAATVLGLDNISPNASRATVLARVQQAYSDDAFTLGISPIVGSPLFDTGSGVQSVQSEECPPEEGKAKFYHVKIHQGSGEGGIHPVFLSANGKVKYVNRGVVEKLSEAFMEVLRNATQTQYFQKPGETMNSTEVPAYPYTIVSISEG